jgi:hypothetical protein
MTFPRILELQVSTSKLFLIRLDQWLQQGKDEHSLPLPEIINTDKFFASLVFEFFDYLVVDNDIIPALKNILPQANMELIVDECCDHNFNNIARVHRILYFLVTTYIRIRHDHQPANLEWNYLGNKALFFIGKSEKYHRIGLLAKLYDAGQLEKIEWSLYVNEGIIKKLRNILSHYSDEEFDNFLNTCVKDLDPIKKQLQPESSHYDGFPYDVKLYENTVLSIISETNYSKNVHHISGNPWPTWITEKTWKAIANHHPFVMVSTPDTLKKLKSMGFKTFENYMEIPDYDSILNDDARLDAIVSNIAFFMSNYHNHINDIKADVIHNAHRFEEIAQHEIDNLHKFMQIDNSTVEDTIDIIKQYNYRLKPY